MRWSIFYLGDEKDQIGGWNKARIAKDFEAGKAYSYFLGRMNSFENEPRKLGIPSIIHNTS